MLSKSMSEAVPGQQIHTNRPLKAFCAAAATCTSQLSTQTWDKRAWAQPAYFLVYEVWVKR
jgi:hypothetical protein